MCSFGAEALHTQDEPCCTLTRQTQAVLASDVCKVVQQAAELYDVSANQAAQLGLLALYLKKLTCQPHP